MVGQESAPGGGDGFAAPPSLLTMYRQIVVAAFSTPSLALSSS
jgi:hypothetical protein